MKISYFFIGGCELCSDSINAESIINICMKYGIFYKDFVFCDGESRVKLTCSFYASKILMDICQKNKIDICITKAYGIPHILKKYRKRYGILLGIIVSILVVWLSGQYVWDVRISGSGNFDKEVLITCLSEQGLYVGSRINNLDIDAIENRVLIDSSEISWIAVNIKGNVAYVEVRKKLTLQESSDNDTPANIVAKCDGQIQLIEANSGEVGVVVGQYVSKGDLLISGIYDSVPLGYRCVRAQGKVWAKTVRKFEVEIPFNYCEKVYIGEQLVQNSIIFLSKEIKLLEKTGFLGATYDTIYKTKQFTLPGEINLPLIQKKTVNVYYEYQDKVRTLEEASNLAFEELDDLMSDIVYSGADVLRKNITCDSDDNSFKLECTLVLIEDIAETLEFKVDNE